MLDVSRVSPPWPVVSAPLRFGRFELQPRERRVLADGQPVALGGRTFDLLVTLAAHWPCCAASRQWPPEQPAAEAAAVPGAGPDPAAHRFRLRRRKRS